METVEIKWDDLTESFRENLRKRLDSAVIEELSHPEGVAAFMYVYDGDDDPKDD